MIQYESNGSYNSLKKSIRTSIIDAMIEKKLIQNTSRCIRRNCDREGGVVNSVSKCRSTAIVIEVNDIIQMHCANAFITYNIYNNTLETFTPRI